MSVKAVVLAAGLGSRLCPLTPFLPKEMLPLGGMPAIHYILCELAEIGIEEAMIVISSEKEKIRDYCLRALFPKGEAAIRLSEERSRILSKIRFSFVTQKELLGTADAIALATEFAGKDPLLVVYPDDLLFLSPNERMGIESLSLMMRKADREGRAVLLCREIPLDAVGNYGVLRLSSEERDGFFCVREIVEKPAEWSEDRAYALIGRMFLTPSVIACIPSLPRNDREGIIPALNSAARSGALSAFLFRGEHWDIGSHEGYLKAVSACL